MSENTLAIIVGKNIALQRKRLGISQKEMAELLEITQDAMARMEKGKIAPKMTRIQDIANKLQCNPSYFFRTDDDETFENARALSEIIKPLSPEGQRNLIDFIATTVSLAQTKLLLKNPSLGSSNTKK